MAELTALFDFRVRADRLEGAPAVIADTLATSRVFPGCLAIEVVADVADPAHIVLIERWDSAESNAAYRAWRATPEGRSSLRDITDGGPTVTQYTTLDI